MSRNILIALFTLVLAAPVGARASGHEEHHAVKHEASHDEHVEPAVAPVHTPKKPGFFGVMMHGFGSFFGEVIAKFDELRTLDENYSAVKSQVAHLEIENEELKNKLAGKGEAHRAKKLKENAKEESGVEHGRTLASLQLSDKTLLTKPPRVIFKSAVAAFEGKDYETSALAFIALFNNEENATYQTAQVAYLAGVSLYHVGNYKGAAKFFEKLTEGVLKDSLSYTPRAMTWLSLCRSQVGDRAGARAIASELVQKYPKSREARRLNRNESF